MSTDGGTSADAVEDRAAQLDATQDVAANDGPHDVVDGDAADAGPGAALHRLVMGWRYACAITPQGGVKCWGENAGGQLGDGTFLPHAAPADVVGVSSGVVSLAASDGTTCALMSSGDLKCWGELPFGDGYALQLSATPVAIVGVHGARAVAAAPHAGACYVDANGEVFCFGSFYGQSVLTTPTKIAGLPPARDIAGVGSRACILSDAREVWCWGYAGPSTFGDGVTETTAVPRRVPGLANVRQLSVSFGSLCAVVDDGAPRCIGLFSPNSDGGATYNTTAVAAQGVTGPITTMGTGPSMACAREATGSVKCWGMDKGARGDGVFAREWLRVDSSTVQNLGAGIDELAVGESAACARDGDDIWCWGPGPVGHDVTPERVPVQTVTGLTDQVDLIAGHGFVCATSKTGALACWGWNQQAGLGDGTNRSRSTPTPIAIDGGVGTATAGPNHVCVTNAVSTGVSCWGANAYGEVRSDRAEQAILSPLELGLSGVTQFALGRTSSCGYQGMQATCWGLQSRSLLLQPTLPHAYDTPTRRASLDRYTSLRMVEDAACGIVGDKTVECWGDTPLGVNDSVPRPVTGATGATALSLGLAHACILTDTGTVKCWGDDGFGQLGNGPASTAPVSVATLVPGLADVVGLDGRGYGACAVRANGDVYCWGDGRDAPTLQAGFNASPKIVVGGPGVCAISKTGTVQCAGSDYYGAVGNGSPWLLPHPVPWLP